jgi:hypothetical protein
MRPDEAAMPSPPEPDEKRSNALDAAIVATVAATRDRRLTVREIAERVGASAETAARCIALHRYFRTHPDQAGGTGALAFPPPPDFLIPAPDQEIDEEALGLGVTAKP